MYPGALVRLNNQALAQLKLEKARDRKCYIGRRAGENVFSHGRDPDVTGYLRAGEVALVLRRTHEFPSPWILLMTPRGELGWKTIFYFDEIET